MMKEYEKDIDVCVGDDAPKQVQKIKGSLPYQGWANRIHEGTTLKDLLDGYPIILEAPDFKNTTEDGLIRITHPISIGYLNSRPTKRAVLTQDCLSHDRVHVEIVKVGDSWFGKVSK